MAIVRYEVMYRYIHPTTMSPVTNTTDEVYGDVGKGLKYVKDYSVTRDAAKMAADLTEQNLPSNPKFDMMFLYNGIEEVANYSTGTGTSIDKHSVNADSFIRCTGQPWFPISTYGSLQAALDAAAPLVMKLGKENVKVVKQVPLGINVGLE